MLMRHFPLFFLFACALAMSGCAEPKAPKDYALFKAAAPRSILVVPVTNKTAQVNAPDNFLVTLPVPLAERGYYVFPVNMVKRTMEDEGIGDADLVAAGDTVRLASLFGADAVLYASIEHWESRYAIVAASTEVSIHYTLKSGKDGRTLWDQSVRTVYQPSASSGNIIATLIADAIVAAIERAHPHYIPLAIQANKLAFYTKGQGIPPGPYDPGYGKPE